MCRCYYHLGLINENQDLVIFIIVRAKKWLQMKATFIGCLINRYNHKVLFKRKESVFNSMFTENRFTDPHVNLFLRVLIFSFTNDITWLFHSEKWFLWMPLSFNIFSMNWSVLVCISLWASSKQICFGSWYFGPLDMSLRRV